ncbi:hypothetical protein HUE58_05610 [Candidatus Ruthia endofausta]|uniref:Uncharacterized protein n=1 Tax=Candidatus Ruthia endofausta TaxID=2738852 RepID=A0A6N0HQQ9_9GAMM|nr:hypothetical protein [Candidatus Ruthia endofausta]QKQ24580.1 hypothetical protein HUE58_05610 [Candidatus Ruthia endofausta]
MVLSLTGVFEGYDLGLYFSGTYIDKPYLEGGLSRMSLDYAIDDQTSISGGVIDYMGGYLPVFEDIKNNDRIFAKVSFF